MYYGSGAIIIHKQNRMMDLFNKYGAICPEKAVSLDEIGIRRSFLFNRMEKRKVFIDCGNKNYYIDNQAAVWFKELRRKRVMITLAVVLVIAGTYYFYAGNL
ncbi:MAG: hypothetical protein Q8920_05800 [Bacillota bacterium]|nr:hypothetical protein [Bacillota bacterium]